MVASWAGLKVQEEPKKRKSIYSSVSQATKDMNSGVTLKGSFYPPEAAAG